VAGAVEPVPKRPHTVTPRLVLGGDAPSALRFYADAFGATVLGEPFLDPDGKVVHTELQIGDSVVFVTDESDDGNGVAPASIGNKVTTIVALNMPNVDQLWDRAVEAGCEVVFPLGRSVLRRARWTAPGPLRSPADALTSRTSIGRN
jgi:uncharacterized glyoxalase superfamily protein PhnB